MKVNFLLGSQRERGAWKIQIGGFNGSDMEVVHTTPLHIPLPRIHLHGSPEKLWEMYFTCLFNKKRK
jgi:hypothetical protein